MYGFALSAVGYRGAALTMPSTGFALAAAYTLFWAQLVQTVALGGWLLMRRPLVVVAVVAVAVRSPTRHSAGFPARLQSAPSRIDRLVV